MTKLDNEVTQKAMQDVLEQFALLVKFMDLEWPEDVVSTCKTMREALNTLEFSI